jgi:hypothetical protein
MNHFATSHSAFPATTDDLSATFIRECACLRDQHVRPDSRLDADRRRAVVHLDSAAIPIESWGEAGTPLFSLIPAGR